MRFVFLQICLAFAWLMPAFAQQQSIEVTDKAGNTVLTFEGDQLKEPGNAKPLYTIKGNIIFEGASDNQNDIKLLVNMENIFAKKKEGHILDASQREELFSVRAGGFYYRSNSTYFDEWLMAHYRKEDGGTIGLYLGTSDTLVCRIKAENVPTGKLTAVFYYFAKKLNWEEEMKKVKVADIVVREDDIPLQTAAVRSTSGTIRKLWNTGQEEFVWDGETLKRKWNSFDYEEWTFDGMTLKRLWYPGQEEMEWDGKVLRRKWYSSNDEFEWNGSIIRRRWGTAADGFIIQGNIIKRAYDNDMDDEWEMDGKIPIPVIAIVVFGLLGK